MVEVFYITQAILLHMMDSGKLISFGEKEFCIMRELAN